MAHEQPHDLNRRGNWFTRLWQQMKANTEAVERARLRVLCFQCGSENATHTLKTIGVEYRYLDCGHTWRDRWVAEDGDGEWADDY
jgi:hypothetical protein